MAHSPIAAEFPDFAPESLPAIPPPWVDTSWHNDTCPSFEARGGEGRELRVFVDYATPADREFPEAARFSVTDATFSDPQNVGVTSDNWADVLAYVLAAHFADVLREWATDEQWATMRRENLDYQQAGQDGICASHNFCDSNMAMDEAFPRAIGRPCALSEDSDGTESPDFALWNAAWGVAKPRFLTATPEEAAAFDAAEGDDDVTSQMSPEELNGWRALGARMNRRDALAILTAEFAAWTASHGIAADEGDALELLMADRTPAQRAWLGDFIRRWEAASGFKES